MAKSKPTLPPAPVIKAAKPLPAKTPLSLSRADAKREAADLRRDRDRLDDTASESETSIRSSLI